MFYLIDSEGRPVVALPDAVAPAALADAIERHFGI
jgi:hypothetical protein